MSVYDSRIEDAGPARKRLTITVPADVIDERIQASLGTLASKAQIPGFRKGRAPNDLLERRFGKTVRAETKNQVIADGYSTALEEHKIRPVGEPEPVGNFEEIEIELGKPMTFSVEIEVVPDFELPSWEGIELTKPVLDVTEEHVEDELKRQCFQLGETVDVAGPIETFDRLIGPVTATIDGEDKPFFRHDNVAVVMPAEDDGGRGNVLGLLVDGLRATLEGKKVGDTVSIHTVGPESHELANIRGKKLTIELTVRDVKRIVPAEVSAVVAHYEMGTAEVLREQVRLALEQRRNQEQQGIMREQVYRHLVDAIDFDLPEKLSSAQAGRIIERQRMEMLHRGGMSEEEVEERLAEVRAETEQRSRQRLKLHFLLHRFAAQFEVQVNEHEVNGRIAQIALERGLRPDKLRQDLMQSGAINQVATQIREHKTADRIIEKAKINEIPVEEWRKMQGEEPAAKAAPASKKKTTTKKTTSSSTKKTPSTSKKTGGARS
jgi:trigger factor